MRFNGLAGSLPREIGYLSEVTLLEIKTESGLVGELPGELGHLSKLESLVLDSTGVSGEIPPEIGHLTNLKDAIHVQHIGDWGAAPRNR